MVLLGSVLWAQVGRFAEAESLLRSAIERLERVRGPNHPDTAKAMDSLGELYGLNSYPEKAEPLHREALRIHTKELGEEHPATLTSMLLLAISLHNQQRLEESAALNRRVMELRRRVLGPEHMDTLARPGKPRKLSESAGTTLRSGDDASRKPCRTFANRGAHS